MRPMFPAVIAGVGICAIVACLVSGCKPDSAVTQTEEQRFKNPPKEIPPEALKIMREHSGGPPAGTVPPK